MGSSRSDRRPVTTGLRERPRVVWAVVVLVWIEALAAAVAAGALVVVVARGSQLAAASLTLAVLAAGLALVLAAAGRALLGGRRWARSPVITVHVLVVAMSLASWRTAPAPWPGVGAVLGVAVVTGLLLPAVAGWTAASGSDVADGERPRP